MKAAYVIAVAASVALCVWLFLYEEAAKPGDLSVFHEEIDQCSLCHRPWRGVSDDRCLQCHSFTDVSFLTPEIRFHEAEDHCLKCHVEHRGGPGDISRMDHTLLNGRLMCTRCHTDVHSGLFGSDCRECHGIKTWDIPGFRHPPQDERQCSLCHAVPFSHEDTGFWKKIEMTHEKEWQDVERKDCWRCHTTRNWRHLIMAHQPEKASLPK